MLRIRPRKGGWLEGGARAGDHPAVHRGRLTWKEEPAKAGALRREHLSEGLPSEGCTRVSSHLGGRNLRKRVRLGQGGLEAGGLRGGRAPLAARPGARHRRLPLCPLPAQGSPCVRDATEPRARRAALVHVAPLGGACVAQVLRQQLPPVLCDEEDGVEHVTYLMREAIGGH